MKQEKAFKISDPNYPRWLKALTIIFLIIDLLSIITGILWFSFWIALKVNAPLDATPWSIAAFSFVVIAEMTYAIAAFFSLIYYSCITFSLRGFGMLVGTRLRKEMHIWLVITRIGLIITLIGLIVTRNQFFPIGHPFGPYWNYESLWILSIILTILALLWLIMRVLIPLLSKCCRRRDKVAIKVAVKEDRTTTIPRDLESPRIPDAHHHRDDSGKEESRD